MDVNHDIMHPNSMMYIGVGTRALNFSLFLGLIVDDTLFNIKENIHKKAAIWSSPADSLVTSPALGMLELGSSGPRIEPHNLHASRYKGPE